MINNNSFEVKPGLFSLCSFVWDKENKRYIEADASDIVKCCLKECEKPIEFCLNYCNDTYGKKSKNNQPAFMHKCIQNCTKQQLECVQVCRANKDYWYNSLIEQCSRDKNCFLSNNDPDKDCIIRNKKEILNCCHKKCIPSKDLNCYNYCDVSYIANTTPEKLGIPRKKVLEQPSPPIVKKENFNIKPILIGSFLGIFFGILLGIISKIKKD